MSLIFVSTLFGLQLKQVLGGHIESTNGCSIIRSRSSPVPLVSLRRYCCYLPYSKWLVATSHCSKSCTHSKHIKFIHNKYQNSLMHRILQNMTHYIIMLIAPYQPSFPFLYLIVLMESRLLQNQKHCLTPINDFRQVLLLK